LSITGKSLSALATFVFALTAAAGTTAPPKLEPLDAAGVPNVVHKAGAKAVLVNVWATWCPPCRAEFPSLLRVAREWKDRGLALTLISADLESDRPSAEEFLRTQGVDFPSFIKTGPDEPFINSLSPVWTGAIPATFLFDGAGQLSSFRQGMMTQEELQKMVRSLLEAEDRIP
jgi:thiol-disulfide isomerase/thioredoxin